MSRDSALLSNGGERVAKEKRIADALNETGYPPSFKDTLATEHPD